MKYVKAEPSNISIKQSDWQHTFEKYAPLLNEIPAVKHGVTSMESAQKWLECVTKTHSDSLVATCIKQASGIGARDVRALIAYEQGEYYPALSANEIYQSKQLKAFPASLTLARNEEPFIISAVRQVMQERHSIQRSQANEERMFAGKEQLWLKSRPSMYGVVNDQDVIVDIHINRGKDVTHSDELRLHYHTLVACSVGLEPKSLFQVNIQLEPEFKKQLVGMASISPVAEQAAINILKEAIINNADTVELSTRVIQQNQETFDQLARTGQSHWSNMMSGHMIEQTESLTELPVDLANEYTQISKQIVVAKNLKDKAGELESAAREQMQNFAAANQINGNFKLPYDATTLRTSTKFDLQGLHDVLTTQFNVDSTSLKKAAIDVDTYMHLLDKSAKSHQPISHEQLTAVIKYDGFNEAGIKTAAEQYGIDLDDYSEQHMKVYMSGQSRGDIYNAMQAIKNEIGMFAENLTDELIESPSLDDERLKQNLANTGVSHSMDF
ncbi:MULTISPECIES: hypothetical protein [Pseudoalteromonas]|uniref:hypothetical protein n=1 Tax=Pseudoalteromonas TaxID=53246 RepID=UPI001582FBE6|nr:MULTISPECIES: hypothetical protein [Pseudoalteromonas]MDI4652591.1 hypothetical protein [Pseudoalteromonas shioyasakiensis]NUJ38701.1 hypothetical protein [Pseudoalteromonas sp. 0303]